MITLHQKNFGKGINRWAERDGKIIATLHRQTPGMPGKWSVNWMTGRIDWHMTLADARDNVLKGN